MKEYAYALLALAFSLMLAASSVSARETITIQDDLGSKGDGGDDSA